MTDEYKYLASPQVYGRLNLITAHAASSASGDADAGSDARGMPGPEVVFEDGSEDEPDAEDPFAPAGPGDDDDEDEDDDERDDDEMSGSEDDDDLDGLDEDDE